MRKKYMNTEFFPVGIFKLQSHKFYDDNKITLKTW